MFILSSYVHKGNTYKQYIMTRDGFTLLAMGFTGAKALEFKLKFIDAFNSMETMLVERKDYLVHKSVNKHNSNLQDSTDYIVTLEALNSLLKSE